MQPYKDSFNEFIKVLDSDNWMNNDYRNYTIPFLVNVEMAIRSPIDLPLSILILSHYRDFAKYVLENYTRDSLTKNDVETTLSKLTGEDCTGFFDRWKDSYGELSLDEMKDWLKSYLPYAPQIVTTILRVGQTSFTVNGTPNTLDSPPIIRNSRTLLPIRAVIESLGGTVVWDATERKVTVTLDNTTLELWIGKPQALVNRTSTAIDSTNSKVVPEIINGRTMLLLRFVAENFGCDVQWEPTTKTITITREG